MLAVTSPPVGAPWRAQGKIFSLPSLTDEERAGLRLLDSWRRYRRRRAQENDALFKLIKAIVRGEQDQVGRRHASKIIPDSFKYKPPTSVLGAGGAGSVLGAAAADAPAGGWAECSLAINELARKQVRA